MGEHLKLWYDAPADPDPAAWESGALPVGGGALGAIQLGGVAVDRLAIDEKTLWTGGPHSREGYDHGIPGEDEAGGYAAALAELRRRIAEDGEADPEQAVALAGRPRTGYGSHQVLGHLVPAFPGHTAEPGSYRRELDLESAVARVRYVSGGVRYVRELFASHPDGVLALRVSADRAGALAMELDLPTPDNRTRAAEASGTGASGTAASGTGSMAVSGALHDNGMRYAAALRVAVEGRDGDARLTARPDGGLSIAGADAVTVLLAAATDFAGGPEDPEVAAARTVQAAAERSWVELLERHTSDHRALFDRVGLDIGQHADAEGYGEGYGDSTDGEAPDLPTDRLLAAYGTPGSTPAADRRLEALFFQYGRYLLIASSRAGSLPAHLQGVWNDTTAPPWGADYHTNINLQMCYWLAETANLRETVPPLVDFVDALREPGRLAARRMLGAERGWVVHNETNPFGFTGVHDWATSFWFPEGAAWCALHLMERWRFGGDGDAADLAFLRERAWPVLREAAEFWLEALVADPRDGTLVANPSYSPEHGVFTAGAAMAQQIVAELFDSVSEAAAVLGPVGEDAAVVAEVAKARERLDPGLRIGDWGQLREWKEERDDPEDHHRHVSQLFALHPGRAVTPASTPELADAARATLRARGDGGTGWSKAWKINFWARLEDGDHAHLMLRQLLRESVLPNLWDTHPPFQLDGNLGATAGIAEMLLASHEGELVLLPALPSAWARAGSVRGLRARGGLEVDLAWRDGVPTRVVLRASRGGRVAVRGVTTLDVTAGESYTVL
ncbi:hypothetical protein BIV57_16335 [Mangrovactinospora gilvigrisea]|uniref:Alpha-L-fucosidase n=1 Tax=Mangrovactinospora gilvigrisea TaxID=1428644 RepID=A0A1J7BCK2_9ACTN|nr:glycoside hydrolase family 95 protein [Mangrovactinospora gilvigrisea]OIV36431.1 hypothetical protein BIV57_16335 [Mangrovactinospora gilvigrisea]